MSDKPLDDLNAAREQWTERRRQLAASMVHGAGALSLSDDSLSEQFMQAQSMIEAIDRALADEKIRQVAIVKLKAKGKPSRGKQTP